MREHRKALKFKKFKIANLQISGIKGGTDSNPCQNTNHGDPTQVNCDPQGQSLPYECTVFAGRTDLKNGCTDPDSATNTTDSGSQASG